VASTGNNRPVQDGQRVGVGEERVSAFPRLRSRGRGVRADPTGGRGPWDRRSSFP
jgi:hypothetical protein